MEDRGSIARHYLAFAEEAGPESPCFADWATRAAGDVEVLDRLTQLPGPKRQPNLVFAAARAAGAVAPGPYESFREVLLTSDAARALILSRSTQTNEVGRLAVLMPAFARLAARAAAPVSLLEVGASAGLCLYPDRYDYDWVPLGRLTGSGGVTLSCAAAGPVPIPAAPLPVARRAGIDLHPLDVHDETEMAWLRTLVWPEQDERRARLDAAIEVARREPPHLVTGDLLELLEGEVERAARFGRVVVFHSAVAAYLAREDREAFAARMRALVAADRCDWVSNEGERVFPAITGTVAGRGRPDERFVLGVNGRAVAWTQGHGASTTWCAPQPCDAT